MALVLGGARSGKSEVGERLAGEMGRPVTYVATGVGGGRPVTYVDTGGAAARSEGDGGEDPSWSERLAAHRARRPAGWSTIELGTGADLGGVLAGLDGTALVDSLGTWLAGQDGFSADGEGLGAVLAQRRGDTIVVSDEVGLGVHPSSEAGRRFRDALGALNRQVANRADHVLLVVAGMVLPLEPPAGLVLPVRPPAGRVLPLDAAARPRDAGR